MAEQIDVESALEDAIFDLVKIEDMQDQGDMRRKVADVIEECLRPALAATKATPERQQAPDIGAQLFSTACAIDRVATAAARNDPDVHSVLAALLDLYEHVGGHNHWDAQGNHGATCPVCIDQRKAKERVWPLVRAAQQDPGVLPVLRVPDCKVAKLSAPELLASIKPEMKP